MKTVSSLGTRTRRNPRRSPRPYTRKGMLSLFAVVVIACGAERKPDFRQSEPPTAGVEQQVRLRSVAAPPPAYITRDAKSIEPHQAENVVVRSAATDPSEAEK